MTEKTIQKKAWLKECVETLITIQTQSAAELCTSFIWDYPVRIVFQSDVNYMCVCIAVFESILRVKSGDSLIWWVPLNILSSFYNKLYKTKYTESSITLNKIRSLPGGSSEHGFRENRPCYIHGRTHVGISDVTKAEKVLWPTSQIK